MLAMVVAIKMAVELYNYQKIAIDELKSGSILCGGVGSGKSRTALAYYFVKECGGSIKIDGVGDYSPMKEPKDLYIITTARKRDLYEWQKECAHFLLFKVVVDSWQNIGKYKNVDKAFFIFDEQRVVGSGSWVKSFLEITKKNKWILLSATPGDTWMDYIPVFIANGFYKNRTQFIRQHVVYSSRTKFPKVDRYVETMRLMRLKKQILVNMDYIKPTSIHNKIIDVDFDEEAFRTVKKKRWNIFTNKPIKNISEFCQVMRKVVNSDPDRIRAIKDILKDHPKLIIFYNFNYELDTLRKMAHDINIPIGEWNGYKHELIPKGERWLYLVQYAAGAEGWNCIETDTIAFFSQSYSYKTMVQAAGRIDRVNTPFKDLYYYHLRSNSEIDRAIASCLKMKKNFNEREFTIF